MASPSGDEGGVTAEADTSAIPAGWKWDATRYEAECARVSGICDEDLLSISTLL